VGCFEPYRIFVITKQQLGQMIGWEGQMPLGWLLGHGSVSLLANQKSTLSRPVESICMSVSTGDGPKNALRLDFW